MTFLLGVNGPPGSATMEPVSTTQLADVWQARLDHWGRLLLLPLLAAATGLAAISVAGGYGTWSRFERGLVVVSAAAAWSVMHTCRPRPARHRAGPGGERWPPTSPSRAFWCG